MKERLKTFITFFTVTILIITIFLKSNRLSNIVIFSSNLFIKNIFPSLFPMFLISNILLDLNFPYYLGKIFKKPMSFLFKSSSYSSFVFFMSMISGFPSSAKYIDDLIKRNLINNEMAEKILIYTFFSNPLFIVNTVGNIFFNSTIIGLFILISHILGNLITGLIFRNYKTTLNENKIIKSSDKINIFNSFSSSIKESLEILINIFGMVTFFLIVINILIGKPNSFLEIFITGIFEMTSGLKYLSLSNFPLNIKLYLSMFFISFGGLSIHFQIFSILSKRRIKYIPFLISRLCHALSSILVLFILLSLDKLF